MQALYLLQPTHKVFFKVSVPAIDDVYANYSIYLCHDKCRGFGFVTFTDSVVAQKVVNMQHVIRKSTLNVSYADPKGAPPRMPPYSQPQAAQASFGSPITYGPPQLPRAPEAQQAVAPRYPYSVQSPAAPYGVAGYEGYSQTGQQDTQAANTMVC